MKSNRAAIQVQEDSETWDLIGDYLQSITENGRNPKSDEILLDRLEAKLALAIAYPKYSEDDHGDMKRKMEQESA